MGGKVSNLKRIGDLVAQHGKERFLEKLTQEERSQLERIYRKVLVENDHEGLESILEAGIPVDMEFEIIGDKVSRYLVRMTRRKYSYSGGYLKWSLYPITPIKIAIMCCKQGEGSKCVELLLKYGLDLKKSVTATHGVPHYDRGVYTSGHCCMGIDICTTPLYCACIMGNSKVVTCLLDNGVPVDDNLFLRMIEDLSLDYKHKKALIYFEIIELLLKYGDMENGKFTMLGHVITHWISNSGSANVAELLLTNGLDGNAKCSSERDSDPLLFSALWNRKRVTDTTNCIQFLLQHGADINAVNDKGQTILHYYFIHDMMFYDACNDVLPFLSEHIQDINHLDCDNMTAWDHSLTGVSYVATSPTWWADIIRNGGRFNSLPSGIIEDLLSNTYRDTGAVGYIVNSFWNWNYHIVMEDIIYRIHSDSTKKKKVPTATLR